MRTPTDNTIAFIKRRARSLRNCGISCVVLDILFELGVPTGKEGFAYLKDAICLRYINPYWTLNGNIYAAISAKNGGLLTFDQIDNAICSVLTEAWEMADLEKWKLFFPTVLRCQNKKPTNKEFIYELAYIVEMWRGCGDSYEQQKEVNYVQL